MWWTFDAVLELILILLPPVGITLTWIATFRSRPLTPSPMLSFVLILGLFATTISYGLFVLESFFMGLAPPFFASYPSRGVVLFGMTLCFAGFWIALSGKGRFRSALSISSVVLASAWLWELTSLPWRVRSGQF